MICDHKNFKPTTAHDRARRLLYGLRLRSRYAARPFPSDTLKSFRSRLAASGGLAEDRRLLCRSLSRYGDRDRDRERRRCFTSRVALSCCPFDPALRRSRAGERDGERDRLVEMVDTESELLVDGDRECRPLPCVDTSNCCFCSRLSLIPCQLVHLYIASFINILHVLPLRSCLYNLRRKFGVCQLLRSRRP